MKFFLWRTEVIRYHQVMKRFLPTRLLAVTAVFALALSATFAAKSTKSAPPAVGEVVELKFHPVKGKNVNLANMKGKVVLIDFWATWCGPCVAEMPNVIAAYNKLHEKGFEIVGISLDQDKAALTKFIKDKEMPWPQYFDGKGWDNEIATRFGVSSIPAMWLVGKDGKLVSTSVRGQLEAVVEKELAK